MLKYLLLVASLFTAADAGAVGRIRNSDISASAGIVYSKLNLSGSIVNADISNSASIANSKLASMLTQTIKCRTSGTTGVPEDCTATESANIIGIAPQYWRIQTASPSAPPGTHVYIYPRGSSLYFMNSSGVETELNTGSGGGVSLLYSSMSAGTGTWNPGATGYSLIIAAGGGGGGGGGGNGSNGSEAGEGGGGSACIGVVTSSAQLYTATVGAGGAGGSAGGGATGTNGTAGSDTTVTNADGAVVFRCTGGIAGGHGTSASTKFWKNLGGHGGSPTCNVNTGAAGADGEDGGYSKVVGRYAIVGAKGTGTGDSGGTCGGGGGGSGAFGEGGAAGGGYSCSAASNGAAGGGGGGGGSSGHPSVCNGTAGGTGGAGGIWVFSF